MRKGLNRLLNNQKVYKELLLNFPLEYSNFAELISEAIEKKDMNQATFLAHSLKGSSGTIGATKVYQTTLKLEEALKLNDFGNLEELQNNLSEALIEVLNSINSLQKNYSEIKDDIPFELEKTSENINKLYQHLSNNNFDSMASYLELKENLTGSYDNDLLFKLDHDMNNYSFEEAIITVIKIAEKLGINLREEEK